MSEQQNKTDDSQEAAGVDTQEGSNGENDSIVARADKAAERLEAANRKTEELLKRQEDLAARDKLGGRSGGAPQETKPKEMSPKEYSDQVLSGNVPK